MPPHKPSLGHATRVGMSPEMGRGLRTWIERDEGGFWILAMALMPMHSLCPHNLVRFSTTVLPLRQLPRASQSPAIPPWHSRRQIPHDDTSHLSLVTIFSYLPRKPAAYALCFSPGYGDPISNFTE